jgi:hypothetical protein
MYEMKKRFSKGFLSKPSPPKKGEVNYPFIDRFTFVHFLIGVGYGWLGFGFGLTLLLALAWELLENPLKYHLPFIFPHGTADTLKNSVGDSLAVILGWGSALYFLRPM